MWEYVMRLHYDSLWIFYNLGASFIYPRSISFRVPMAILFHYGSSSRSSSRYTVQSITKHWHISINFGNRTWLFTVCILHNFIFIFLFIKRPIVNVWPRSKINPKIHFRGIQIKISFWNPHQYYFLLGR